MTFGWIIPCLFVICVVLSLAELASAMPYALQTIPLFFFTYKNDRTSAGLYYFSAKLSPPKYAPLISWITGWANVTGQIMLVCSIEFVK